ncbi:MAG: response regulator [Bacteroidota bacterium]
MSVLSFYHRAPAGEPPCLDGLTLLLVDDDSVNCILMSEFLQDTRAGFLWAHNGKVAVDMVRNNKVDIILMDYRMPVMNGYEASKKIREINPDIPIILISANCRETSLHGAEAGLFDQQLSKPLSENAIFSAITKCIEQKGEFRNVS